MAIKKTDLPLTGGADALEKLDGKERIEGGKVEKSFSATLAEVAGQIEQVAGSEKAESAVRAAFRQIALNTNLDSPEDAMTAVRESARFLVTSRLNDGLRDTEQGRKISEDLSGYISSDPFLHRKILGILQNLK